MEAVFGKPRPQAPQRRGIHDETAIQEQGSSAQQHHGLTDLGADLAK